MKRLHKENNKINKRKLEGPFCSSYCVEIRCGEMVSRPLSSTPSVAFPDVQKTNTFKFPCLMDKINVAARDKCIASYFDHHHV